MSATWDEQNIQRPHRKRRAELAQREEHRRHVPILLCPCLKEHSRTEVGLPLTRCQVLPDCCIAFSLECKIFFMNSWCNSNIPSLGVLLMSQGYFSLPHPLGCPGDQPYSLRLKFVYNHITERAT